MPSRRKNIELTININMHDMKQNITEIERYHSRTLLKPRSFNSELES